jgi:SAM-dependent methyltransferase
MRSEPESTAFYDDAQRYDLVSGALSGKGPVEFYRTQAIRSGGPVLELACGTGRLAIPIACDGIEVVGLDASPEMLSLAEQKSAGKDLPVAWTRGDMRAFDLGRRFPCIFVASNSFSHLYARTDIESCLGSVRRHLASPGRFVFDIFNPAPGLFLRQSEQRIPLIEYVDPRSGSRVEISKTVRYDSAAQISHETWFFRQAVTGEEQQNQLHLRMFFPQEIEALLHYNGFQIDQRYGDYQNALFAGSSNKQVIVCTAA